MTFQQLARMLIGVIAVSLAHFITWNTYAAINIDEYRKSCKGGEINLCASLGIVYERQGKIEESKIFYKKACDHSPWNNQVMGCSGLAALLENEGAIQEARRLFRKPCDHGQWYGCYKWANFELRQNNIKKFEHLIVKTCKNTKYIPGRGTPLLSSCSDAFEYFLEKGQYKKAKVNLDKICSVQKYEIYCNKFNDKYSEASEPIVEYRVFKKGNGVSLTVYTLRKNYYVIAEKQVIKLEGSQIVKAEPTHTLVFNEFSEYGPFAIASDFDLSFSLNNVEKSTVSYNPKSKKYFYKDSYGKIISIEGGKPFLEHPPEVLLIRSISVEGLKKRYLLVRWADDSKCEFGCCKFTYSLITVRTTPKIVLWDQHGCDV